MSTLGWREVIMVSVSGDGVGVVGLGGLFATEDFPGAAGGRGGFLALGLVIFPFCGKLSTPAGIERQVVLSRHSVAFTS